MLKHSTVPHYNMLHYNMLYYNILYNNMLHYNMLHYNMLHYNMLQLTLHPPVRTRQPASSQTRCRSVATTVRWEAGRHPGRGGTQAGRLPGRGGTQAGEAPRQGRLPGRGDPRLSPLGKCLGSPHPRQGPQALPTRVSPVWPTVAVQYCRDMSFPAMASALRAGCFVMETVSPR